MTQKGFSRRLVGALLLATSTCGSAVDANSIPDFLTEPGVNPTRSYAVDANGTEYVDPMTGVLRLSYTDLVVPGNGGLDIAVQRTYHTSPGAGGAVGQLAFEYRVNSGIGWDIHFGRVLSKQSTCLNDNVDSRNNPVLQLPDGSRQVFFRPIDDSRYDWITKDRWIAKCENYSYNSGGRIYNTVGMSVRSPDGLAYTFSWDDVWQDPNTADLFVWHPTRIQDRNGNHLLFWYRTKSAHLTAVLDQIVASDGRVVDFTYANAAGTHPRIRSIELRGGVGAGGSHRWEYIYTPIGLTGSYYLTAVVGPENYRWRYDYHTVGGNFDPEIYKLRSVTSPYGGRTEYTYQYIDRSPFGVADVTVGIQSKTTYNTLSDLGGAAEGEWRYSFYFEDGAPYDYARIERPDGAREVYLHCATKAALASLLGECNGGEEGALVRKEIYADANAIVPLQSEDYLWGGQTLSRQIDFRPAIQDLSLRFRPASSRILLQRTITRDGVSHTVSHYQQNEHDNPGVTIEYAGPALAYEDTGGLAASNLRRRETRTTWFADLDHWIIRQPATQLTFDVFDHPGVQRTYDPRGNLATLSEHGRVSAYEYHADGTPRLVIDPVGNRTEYGNYFRGTARAQSHPEQVTLSRTVNNAGQITSETNGRGYTTQFHRDTLGRITRIVTPRTDDNDITVAWSFSNGDALGFRGRRLTRGTFVEERVLDGFGREIRVDAGGIRRDLTYDALGRKTFESYPNSGEGTRYEYDALDRLTRVTHTVDGSFISYQFRAEGTDTTAVEITDELGFVSTHVFHAYSDPDDWKLERVDQPESVSTLIERTRRGDILTVSQGNTNGDSSGYVRRERVYDSRYLIDFETHPEVGKYDFSIDDAGNKTSSRLVPANGGLASPATNFAYDGLNRLDLIDFPENTPDIDLAYDKNGNLISASRGGIVRTYQYDVNDNLVREIISIDDRVYEFEYAYDANDAVTRIIYPNGLTIDYDPNALGWPTRAGELATNIVYHANGAPASMTLASGIDVQISQTGRLLTDTIVAGNTVQLDYDYDSHANPRSVIDTIDSSRSVLNIDYDGIHRLRNATAQMYGGMVAFSYDDWANISQRTIDGRTQSFIYQACVDILDPTTCRPTYKLEHVLGTGRKYSYDIYGNVTDNGRTTFRYDHSSDLVQAGNDQYRYDGHQRRTVVVTPRGARISLYNKAGVLLYEDDRINNVQSAYVRLGAMLVARQDQVCEVGDPDSDNDGIPDCEEMFLGFDIDGTVDGDLDGATNAEEFAAGSDYFDEDSDDDEIPDGYEIDNGIDPTDAADQLADPDADGLSNRDEYLNNTFAQDFDSDDDFIPDGYEVDNGLLPRIPDANGDPDNDALVNLREYEAGTRADTPDTDGDDLLDGAEIDLHGTDPNDIDTDDDEMPDGYEVANGLDPLLDDAGQDLDGDGFSNGHEFAAGTNPGDPNDRPEIGAALWRAPQLGLIYARSAVSSNRVLSVERPAPAFDDVLRAYRLFSDTWTWERPVNGSVRGHPSIGADDAVYVVVDDDGELVLRAYDGDGNGRWSASLGTSYRGTQGAPAIDRQGNVYVIANSSANSGVVRSYTSDGQLRWTFASATARFDTALAIGPDGTIYVGTEAPFANSPRTYDLYGLDPQSATPRYRITFDAGFNKGEFGTGIAVSNDGTVFYADGEGRLVALTLTLVQKWRYDAEFVDTPPVVAPDGSVSVSGGCLLQAINTDGSPRWSRCFPGRLDTAAAIGADGTVYIGSFDGAFYAVNADGTDRWSDQPITGFQSVMYAPAMTGRGLLYAGFEALRAYTVEPGNEAVGHWAAEGFDARRGGLAATACGYVDSDADGLPDCVEAAFAGGLSALGDADGDGLDNLAEFLGGSAIDAPDTDGDGLGDGAEIAAGASPLVADGDGDGLGDAEEVARGLDPGNPDSDGDTLHDGYEVAEGLDPADPADGAPGQDLDGDGFDNVDEFRFAARAGDPTSYPGSTVAMLLSAVSVDLSGTATGNGHSDFAASSSDGRHVVFRSLATDLVPGIVDPIYQVYWRDREAAITRLVSVARDGATPGAFASGSASVSDDGRYVAFASSAPNLVAGDTNGLTDVFVRDMVLDTTLLVSRNRAGTGVANAASGNPQVSGDGRYVFFTSGASDITVDDTDTLGDVFRFDIAAQENTLVSVSRTGTSSGNGASLRPSITPDGRFAVFRSIANNLVDGDTNGVNDVFLRDVLSGTTVLVSRNAVSTGPGNGHSLDAVVSDDGRFVAFESLASDLVTADTNGQQDVFLHEIATGATVRVSAASDGTSANSFSFVEDISADGRYVAYSSAAANISPIDGNGSDSDVFRFDRTMGVNELVSVNVDASASGDDLSATARLSADGRYVSFLSRATDLTDEHDNNAFDDVFQRDMLLGQTRLVSASLFPSRAGAGSHTDFAVARDGAALTFVTRAEDIVFNDVNGQDFDVVFAAPRAIATQPSAVSLSVDRASPQTTGAVVTLTAVADGAAGPVEYQFLYKGPATSDMWQLLQDYSTKATASWNTAGLLGRYRLQVRARAVGTLPETEVRDKVGFWLNDVNPTTDVQLTADLTSPQQAGTPVLLSASGTGGSGIHEYRFDIKGPGTDAAWVELRAFGADPTFLWDTSGYLGRHRLRVRARNSGSVDKPVRDALRFWVNAPNPATGASISADIPNPVASGTVVTLTATGSGGSGSYDYQFRIKGPATQETWQVLQAFSGTNIVSFDAGNYLGQHRVQVRLRKAGTLDRPVKASAKVWVNGAAPTTGATLTVTPEDPQAVGIDVLVTATGSGDSGRYEYAYSVKGPSTGDIWAVLRDFSTEPVVTWSTAGLLPGRYRLRAQVRNAGSWDKPVRARTTYLLQ